MSRPVALVTGAGKAGGLGAYLAEKLAKTGYALAIHYRSSGADAVAHAARLPEAAAFQADLSEETGARRLIEAVASHWGRLDVLINNAGAYHMSPLAELSPEQWHEGIDSTATATFFTTRAALPWLRRSGRGRVVNIGDAGAGRLVPRNLALGYHIGKTGVLLLTKSFARQEARQGVTVNMVSPGILENSIDLDHRPPIPAGRLGGFEDIWNAVAWLLRPESGYVTGNQIRVSGGWNL